MNNEMLTDHILEKYYKNAWRENKRQIRLLIHFLVCDYESLPVEHLKIMLLRSEEIFRETGEAFWESGMTDRDVLYNSLEQTKKRKYVEELIAALPYEALIGLRLNVLHTLTESSEL